MKYQVIVGNIGNVAHTCTLGCAEDEFNGWVRKSKSPNSRASGEPVTLMEDGEILKEYNPNTVPYNCPKCRDWTMEDIGDRLFQCPNCDEELSKNDLDKILLLDVAYRCREALKLFDLSFSCYGDLKEKLNDVLNIAEK